MSSADPNLVTISGRAGVAVTMRFVAGVEANGIDIDGVAFMLGADGRCAEETDLIFYNNEGVQNVVWHQGDSLKRPFIDGERIFAILPRVPARVQSIVFAAAVHPHEGYDHFHMGMLEHVRVDVQRRPGPPISRPVEKTSFGQGKGLILCHLRRGRERWNFEFSPQPTESLEAMCSQFGLTATKDDA